MEWVLCLIIPLAVLLLNFGAEKLVDGFTRVEWADLYLGLEFVMATIAICFVNFGDLHRLERRAEKAQAEAKKQLNLIDVEVANGANPNNSDILQRKAMWAEKSHAQDELFKEYRHETWLTIACLAMTGSVFVIIAAIHHYWKPKKDDDLTRTEIWMKRVWMAGVGIPLGASCMAVFLLLVKGVH